MNRVFKTQGWPAKVHQAVRLCIATADEHGKTGFTLFVWERGRYCAFGGEQSIPKKDSKP